MFFQEICNTLHIENTRVKDWPGQIIYNHGENNARCTIIAFNPKLHPIAHDIIIDDQ